MVWLNCKDNTDRNEIHPDRRREIATFSWLLEVEWQRRLSLAIAVVYVVISLLVSHPKSLSEALTNILVKFLSLLLPLACIWFGDEMGDYVGMLAIPAITKPSPGGLVRLGGWFLLFMRLIIWWLVYRD